MLKKPPACSSCSLGSRGQGFAPPTGPPIAPIAWVAEALGAEEAKSGEPLSGRAGTIFNRLLYRNRLERGHQRLHNLVACRPPQNKLAHQPYEFSAIAHCRRHHLQPVLEEPRPVVVAMGKLPISELLRIPRAKLKVADFHGRVLRDPDDRYWVVCSYHPSHLARGAMNLFGAVSWGFQRAEEIAREGWEPEEEPTLLQDPPLAVFAAWVERFLAEIRRRLALGLPLPWLAVDVETPDKQRKQDEGELSANKDQSYQILRINFGWEVGEGLTVPWTPPYLPLIRSLLASPAPKVYWNKSYDSPRLRAAGMELGGHQLDAMWMWHALQSDLPRGLGFAAAFYSRLPPWKHLSAEDPVRYAALDPVHTLRAAFGIARDLQSLGMWDVYWRHMHLLDTWALLPSAEVGLLVDQQALRKYGEELQQEEDAASARIQAAVPEEVRPLRAASAGGWTRKPQESSPGMVLWQPQKKTGRERPPAQEVPLVEVREDRLVQVCRACGAEQVAKTHRCRDRSLAPDLALEDRPVLRWYRREPFNPASQPQVLRYLRHRGHRPGVNKQDKSKPSVGKETLQRLWDQTRDPFYAGMLDHRQVAKVNGTYVKGTQERLATDWRSVTDGRLHPTPTHNPSTLRTSYTAPNLQNVVSRDSGTKNLAAGFRKCIVAAPGHLLLEADFSAIEAVITGWFIQDPNFIRLAKLGIHSFVAAELLYEARRLPERADLGWSDERLGAFLKAVKTDPANDHIYNQCKRVVHGTNYGLTLHGMVKQFPKEFPSLAAARKVRDTYFRIAPGLPAWHAQVRRLANRQGYLGGADHPFSYRHWFWDIFTYKRLTRAQYLRREQSGEPVAQLHGIPYGIYLGEDGKRCVAFYPQSTAAGVIKEAMLRLFDPESPSYIGDCFGGRTPLRALIHDSLLLEIPEEKLDWVLERLVLEMQRPIPQLPLPQEWGMGPRLQIGVEVKVGPNWGEMKKLKELPGVAYDELEPEYMGGDDPDEEEERESWGEEDSGGAGEAAGLY